MYGQVPLNISSFAVWNNIWVKKRNLAFHLGLADAWSPGRAPDGSLNAQRSRADALPPFSIPDAFSIYRIFWPSLWCPESRPSTLRTRQSPLHCCYVVHTAQLLTKISSGVKMPLESGPKFWSLVQNLKTLSQNIFIIGWSFSLPFHHSLISSWQASVTEAWAVHGSAATLILPRCVYMGFSLLAWSPEAMKVFKHISPRHCTKRRRGET